MFYIGFKVVFFCKMSPIVLEKGGGREFPLNKSKTLSTIRCSFSDQCNRITEIWSARHSKLNPNTNKLLIALLQRQQVYSRTLNRVNVAGKPVCSYCTARCHAQVETETLHQLCSALSRQVAAFTYYQSAGSHSLVLQGVPVLRVRK